MVTDSKSELNAESETKDANNLPDTATSEKSSEPSFEDSILDDLEMYSEEKCWIPYQTMVSKIETCDDVIERDKIPLGNKCGQYFIYDNCYNLTRYNLQKKNRNLNRKVYHMNYKG